MYIPFNKKRKKKKSPGLRIYILLYAELKNKKNLSFI